jgi:tetratricopeptide (TPR) repeat protein
MSRPSLPLEELLPLFPEVEELEELRFALFNVAVPDPDKAWEKSSEYATVDKRIVDAARAASAVDTAERVARERVEELFRSCRAVLDRYWSGDVAGAAHELAKLGEREEQRSRYQRARRLLDTALSLSLPLGDKAPQIVALRLLGRVLWRQGDLPEAALHYHRGAELARDTGDVRSEVIATTGLGNVRLFQGRWAEAESIYQGALARCEAEGCRDCELQYAQLHNNLGTVAMRLNRLEEAESRFMRALELWAELDSPGDVAICHHNYGLLHARQDRHAAARECFQRALDLPVPSGARAAIATDLALSFLAEGQMAAAREMGREAEEHAIASQSPFVLGSMYRGLGNIARAEGDEGGITFFEKALEIARKKEDLLLEGETLIDYAQLRYHAGEAEEAVSYLSRGREIFELLGDQAEAERAAALLGELDSPSAAVSD